MCKRWLSLIACLALVITAIPAMSLGALLPAKAVSQNDVIMPSNDGLTNNTSYVLGEGTDAEVTVYCDFRSTSQSPTGSIGTPQYVTVHNTGTYVSTANAANTHKNTAKVSSDMTWHYTVDDVSIYQALADTRVGWHIGNVSSNPNPTNTNYNSIGIEMCVHNFPATETFDGEQWTDGTAILQWWEDQFDQTMKNTAYLCLVLCKRWGLDWQTDIRMHYDALNYYPGGKDCPMQMRATYDPITNTFTEAGSYVDGRDGYFWQMFWGYLESYAAGNMDAYGGGKTSAQKLGTYTITPTDGLNVRAGAGSTYEKVGALECGTIVNVTELSGSWGKITLDDGTVGWCNIVDYGKYIGIDAQAFTMASNGGDLSYGHDTNGSLVITNNGTDQGQFDLFTPVQIGTATTPYFNTKITSVSGNGYALGITQNGSGYFMMHDPSSSDALTVSTTIPAYTTTATTLSANLQDYWLPEEGQRIDQIRFYIAPGSTIRLDYCYFAVDATTVVDSMYNVLASNNMNLLLPDVLSIADRTKKGNYVYDNGAITLTSASDSGFDVVFDVNTQFDINAMTRLLIDVQADAPFNIALLVTNANGDGWVDLVNDFYPGFTDTVPTTGYLPAWSGTAGLDLYNYYAYNSIIPTDGLSTVKQVKLSVGGTGTVRVGAVQLARNDRLAVFTDGVYKTDSCGDEPLLSMGDVNGDGAVTTIDARLAMIHAIGGAQLTGDALAAADMNGDGAITTIDARMMMLEALTSV